VRKWSVLLLLVVFAACSPTSKSATPTEPPGGALMAFGNHVAAVELAVTAPEWQKGLMNRKEMDPDHGMAFIFPSSQQLGFWMKDTLIPLSIAFMQRKQGQTYRVAKILDMQPCPASAGNNCTIYNPNVSYDLALEMNLGWFRRNGVHVGSTGRLGRAPKKS